MVAEAEIEVDAILKCTASDCTDGVAGIRDALYVLGGKWKLPLIFTLSNGPLRFKDLQRSLGEITPKMLSKELKELALNGFVLRQEHPTKPLTYTYQLTPYSQTLHKVTYELKTWGTQHRQHIGASKRATHE